MIIKSNDSKVNSIRSNQAELIFWSAVIFSSDQLEMLRRPRSRYFVFEPGQRLAIKESLTRLLDTAADLVIVAIPGLIIGILLAYLGF